MNTEIRYGKWTVIGKDGRHLLTQCDCGTHSRALPFDLRCGKTTMCRKCKFAILKGQKRPSITRHGLSNSPTMEVWSCMKQRCLNPKSRGYERYGGRGIKVCDRWLIGAGNNNGFECFVADMGARPSLKHQLDRKDNDGDYEPRNCAWVLRSQQDYNKRNTFRFKAFGRTFTALEAEAEFGLPRRLIRYRIQISGMSPERALTQPRRITA